MTGSDAVPAMGVRNVQNDVCVALIGVPGKPAASRAAGIAYIPQGGRLFHALRRRANSCLGVHGDAEALSAAVELVQRWLPHLADEFMRVPRSVSVEERQVIVLAIALALSPRYLLLDEPTAVLAPSVAGHVLIQVRALGDGGSTGVIVVEQSGVPVPASRSLSLSEGRLCPYAPNR